MSKRDRRKQEVEPEEIFLHAVSFHIAFRFLHYDWKPSHTAGKYAVNTPAAVLSAFTCELFLKTLVLIETGRIPKNHHLLILFNSLKPATQKRIEELWDEYAVRYAYKWIEIERGIGVPISRDLRIALKLGSKTFELARYAYERGEEFQFYLGALPDMLKKVAFELRPDWKTHVAKGFDDLKLERPAELRDLPTEAA